MADWGDGIVVALPYTDIGHGSYSFLGALFNDDDPASVPVTVSGAVTFDMPTAAGVLVARIPVVSGAVTFDMPEVDGTIVVGVVLSGAVTFDMPEVAGRLGYGLYGAVTFDMPTAAGVVVATIPSVSGAVTFGMPTVAGWIVPGPGSTFTVYVMNLKNKGVTEYESFDFTSACALPDGRVLTTGSDGIYEITGSTDAGAAIAAHIITGANNFGDPRHKNISDIYAEVEGTGSIQVSTLVDKGTEGGAHTLTLPGGTVMDVKRGKMPLGSYGSRWQVKVVNVSGADFELHGLELLASLTGNRV